MMTPFVQVASAMQRNHSGTGLGLPITKHIVEMHGGTLALDSAPRRGTTAIVRLPGERVISAADNGRLTPSGGTRD